MKVLVTGAAGYIGRHVVDKLIERGVEVIAADIRYDGVNEKAKRADINIFEDDKDIFKKAGEPDVLVHMAWRNGFVHNDMSHLVDFPKHFTFIKNMVEGGLKQVVVMGTMHEVGYYEGAIDADTPCNPRSYYGVSKNALRQLTLMLCQDKGVTCQWLRAYYILGDDLKSNSIFSKITQAANDGKKEFPFTTGECKYDFISVDDLAYQIAATATQTEVSGIINCCSGKPVALGERVEQFIKDNNFDIKLQYGVFPSRAYDSPAVWGDSSKIEEIIKINP